MQDAAASLPSFSGEDELSALLLAMVIEHCHGHSWEDEKAGLTSYLNAPHTTGDDLQSYDNPVNAAAMAALALSARMAAPPARRTRVLVKP